MAYSPVCGCLPVGGGAGEMVDGQRLNGIKKEKGKRLRTSNIEL
jgi:hypothetical protein